MLLVISMIPAKIIIRKNIYTEIFNKNKEAGDDKNKDGTNKTIRNINQ